jgi:hypothetical protein
MTHELTYQRLQDEIIDGLSHRIAGGMSHARWESWFMVQRADGSIWDATRGGNLAAQWSLPDAETLLMQLDSNAYGPGHEYQRINRDALAGWIEQQRIVGVAIHLLAVAR